MTTRPPGASAAEQVPIRGLIAAIEAVLREPRRVMFALRQPGAGAVVAALLVIAVFSAAIYGLVVGSFSGGTQWWAAPVKISAGLLVSALICLPSLFIFATLGGATARLAEVFGILAGKLALTTILLIGFAPVAWVFSQSTESLAWMGALHLAFWAIAAFFGARFLHAAFAHLVKSGLGIKVWTIIYLLVALQMTTALRPILGEAEATFLPKDKKFFLAHWGDVMDQAAKAKPTKRSE
ncbi:MAG: hypothetical protein HY301_17425 [Verrucomicrobia bacterium]|nr:hypothetical protein [Verrucomicrobiota bacterium]